MPRRDPFAEARARLPKACLACGSAHIVPTFYPLGEDDWECMDCGVTWLARRGVEGA